MGAVLLFLYTKKELYMVSESGWWSFLKVAKSENQVLSWDGIFVRVWVWWSDGKGKNSKMKGVWCRFLGLQGFSGGFKEGVCGYFGGWDLEYEILIMRDDGIFINREVWCDFWKVMVKSQLFKIKAKGAI